MAQMSKMMDQALNNVFGEESTMSYVDALVTEDEEIIADHIKAKNRRAVRVEYKKNAKIRNKRTYDPSNVRHWSTKAAYNEFRGITPVFHGQDEPVAFIKKSHKNVPQQTWVKIQNRKERYSAVPTEGGAYLRVNTEAIFADYAEYDSYVEIDWDGVKWLTITVNSPDEFSGQYYDWHTWLTTEEAISKGYMEYSGTPQYSHHWEYDNYLVCGFDDRYQTRPLKESIRKKVLTAWDEEKYNLTMEADWQLEKIAKSIKSLMAINRQLQSEKLENIINDLADNYSRKF